MHKQPILSIYRPKTRIISYLKARTAFKTPNPLLQEATNAVRLLNGQCLSPNTPIKVFRSLDNRRLFVGGIPSMKTRDEVWKELHHQGIKTVVDVIMYRSYTNRAHNRGFVFVEFASHRDAAEARCRCKELTLFGAKVVVDWSVPTPPVDQDVLNKVRARAELLLKLLALDF